MWKLYELIKLSSVFIRQHMLPNPFEGYPMADLYNYMAGFILYPISFLVVKLFYTKGSNPPLGAFLYLLFYAIHTGLVALSGLFGFTRLSIYLIFGTYLAILIGIKSLQYRIN